MKWVFAALISACLTASPAVGQATMHAAAIPLTKVTSGYDGPSSLSTIGVIEVGATNPDGSTANVKFQVSPADFVISECAKVVFLSPSSGTTPATVYVGINPGYWIGFGGSCQIYFSTVDQVPVSKTYAILPVAISQPAVPAVTAVYGAADYLPVVSPGAIVSIYWCESRSKRRCADLRRHRSLST